MIKKLVPFSLVFLIFSVSALAATYEVTHDEFTNAGLDTTIWTLITNGITPNNFNFTQDGGGVLLLGGNSTGSADFYLNQTNVLAAGDSGYIEIEYTRAGGTLGTSNNFYFCLSNNFYGSMTCGACFSDGGATNDFYFAKTSRFITMTTGGDSDTHIIKIQAQREANYTNILMWFDGSLVAANPDTSCVGKPIKASIGAIDATYNQYLVYAAFDNYKLYSVVTSNYSGAYCNQNSDCLSGLCLYHSCRLKGEGVACDSYTQCISGECEGGRCTRPDSWVLVENAKEELIGDDTNTNNLFCMVISLVVGVGAAVVLAGATGALMIAGVLGLTVFVMTLTFFAVVGWLSAFILISVYVVLGVIVLLAIILAPRG
jgi:hypothetical protein